MQIKTISGHYDTVFDLVHNNRSFIPKNADPSRTPWNYNCVVTGENVYYDLEHPVCLKEFWKDYKNFTETYWLDYATAKKIAYERYQEEMQKLRRYAHLLYHIPEDGMAAFITLLFLPLLIPCGIYLSYEQQRAKEEFEKFKEEQWIRNMEFKAEQQALREAVRVNDWKNGTNYLHMMDATVREMASYAGDYVNAAESVSFDVAPLPRFATLEEIYGFVFEPSFREFQSRQRPRRRYNGTYLDFIREGRRTDIKKKKQNKHNKNRRTAEAFEIVFGIGDMDNTGYENAFDDAKKSEALLKDFADHLLEDPHMCFVTTKELNNPNWEPPFKNGLIILNLTVHCDEATPGVHLTCIPYSRGCTRGSAVQASLSQAMAGMGYPSTWKDVLDENGERIPKRNKNNEIVYNKDGSVRYLQEADQKGIIDWIDVQKDWLQSEMYRRYGWRREYKGSHPRGNLSTPDYKAARAKERYEELIKASDQKIHLFSKEVTGLVSKLSQSVNEMYRNSTDLELVLRFLKTCPEERYEELFKEAYTFFSKLPEETMQNFRQNLNVKVSDADKRAQKKQTEGTSHRGRSGR